MMKHASEFRAPLRNPLPAPSESDAARARRQAAWVHGFCVAVLDSYAEQEFHNGERFRYGLTQDDAKYARAVYIWTDHDAAMASWMGDDVNRYTHGRAAAAGLQGLDQAQQGRLSAMPKAPESPRPESLRKPPDWPADPAAPEAVAAFLSARMPR